MQQSIKFNCRLFIFRQYAPAVCNFFPVSQVYWRQHLPRERQENRGGRNRGLLISALRGHAIYGTMLPTAESYGWADSEPHTEPRSTERKPLVEVLPKGEHDSSERAKAIAARASS